MRWGGASWLGGEAARELSLGRPGLRAPLGVVASLEGRVGVASRGVLRLGMLRCSVLRGRVGGEPRVRVALLPLLLPAGGPSVALATGVRGSLCMSPCPVWRPLAFRRRRTGCLRTLGTWLSCPLLGSTRSAMSDHRRLCRCSPTSVLGRSLCHAGSSSSLPGLPGGVASGGGVVGSGAGGVGRRAGLGRDCASRIAARR